MRPARLTTWIVLLISLAIATGTLVSGFLWALDRVTALRQSTPVLLFALPLAGALVAMAYARAGRGVERGNNLILDEIHEPGGGVPTRLAPLVLIGTLFTHLCGGSAGREGTAVQMGGALAAGMDRHLLARSRATAPLSASERAMLLQAGIAAGFGAVFGTPFAGAVFAIEVLRVGRLTMSALIPCLVAALLADQVTLAWGIHHTPYPSVQLTPSLISAALLGKVVLVGLVCGLVSRLFSAMTHGVSWLLSRTLGAFWLRPIVGGVAIIGLTYLFGTRDYLGLGVTSPDLHAVTITSAFREGGAHASSWLLKTVFTALTVGSGFKGGEVTPLFFVGATLGNTAATLLQMPIVLGAAVGFVAVFAGATNTPLACTIMAMELFGLGITPFAALACGLAFAMSGPTGVYTAQRPRRLPTDTT